MFSTSLPAEPTGKRPRFEDSNSSVNKGEALVQILDWTQETCFKSYVQWCPTNTPSSRLAAGLGAAARLCSGTLLPKLRPVPYLPTRKGRLGERPAGCPGWVSVSALAMRLPLPHQGSQKRFLGASFAGQNKGVVRQFHSSYFPAQPSEG